MTNFTIRKGKQTDQFAVFCVFRLSLYDLLQKMKVVTSIPTLAEIENLYEYYRSFLAHIYDSCDQFWVAEADGQVVGYARSIVRDGVRQLTEFFVMPDHQGLGAGSQLLAKAFPKEGTQNRVICASPDTRALIRYLKTGVRSRTTIYEWSRIPEAVPFETDLVIKPIENTPANIAILNEIDHTILGYTRETDHHWLIQNKRGHFYLRQNQVVGYSYFANRAGPIAMLNNVDFPVALAHIETEMTATVDEVYNEIILCVPMSNPAAVDYVIRRGYHTNAFFEHFLTDKPLGHYENYIFIDPILTT